MPADSIPAGQSRVETAVPEAISDSCSDTVIPEIRGKSRRKGHQVINRAEAGKTQKIASQNPIRLSARRLALTRQRATHVKDIAERNVAAERLANLGQRFAGVVAEVSRDRLDFVGG